MNLNQITVPVISVEQSIDFYLALGLKLIVRSLPHYARFECPDGGSSFSLHRVDSLPQGEGAWIYFEVPDVDKTAAALLEKGISLEEMPNDKPWLWREARLKDLDQNQLIIYHAGENRLNPPWKLSE